MIEEHTYKMYSIVLKQLDGINGGVQTTHGVCEYIRKHWEDKDLQQWLNTDKTLIILNGGSTQNIEHIITVFKAANVKFETFEEEDLGNLTTSICVLADERVWSKQYMSCMDYLKECTHRKDCNPMSADFIKTAVHEYHEYIGGDDNAVKKFILNDLKTA